MDRVTSGQGIPISLQSMFVSHAPIVAPYSQKIQTIAGPGVIRRQGSLTGCPSLRSSMRQLGEARWGQGGIYGLDTRTVNFRADAPRGPFIASLASRVHRATARRIFITKATKRCIEGDGSLRDVQRLAGHSSPRPSATSKVVPMRSGTSLIS